jgi:chromosome segregation ATPase
MYLAHDGLERHLRAIDARLLTLTKQMAEVRQVLNQHAAILNEHLEALMQHKAALEQHREELRALATRVTNLEAARSLTLEHQVEVRTWMRALAHQTGQPTPALERELAAALGVETISQLTEAVWDEVAAWFHQRLGW